LKKHVKARSENCGRVIKVKPSAGEENSEHERKYEQEPVQKTHAVGI
jgi:hypothetical protein